MTKAFRIPLFLLCLLAFLAPAGGCSVFRRIFSGDSVAEGNRIVDAERRERKRARTDEMSRRDPVNDMFELKQVRDRPVRHQGIPLTGDERAIFDAAEDSAARDRALIDAEKRRMSSDRKARKDWVFSFKPSQQE